jgi:hypothetical protein
MQIEPLTTLHIDLHDNRFVTAHGTFCSILHTYSSIPPPLNDDHELGPEFVLQPEVLRNLNQFHLEIVDGKSVSEVVLPPWVSSGLEFVYLNRKALERDFELTKSHHGVELMFRYQQPEQQAEKLDNLFNENEMYDDIWDGKTLKTDHRQKEIDATIDHLGQVPPQLFFAPHPQPEMLQLNSTLDLLAIVTLPAAEYLFPSCSVGY